MWANYVPIDRLLGDVGLGSMAGRTWVIAPDASSLERSWKALVRQDDAVERALLFHPHLRKGVPGDKHIAKATIGLGNIHGPVVSVEAAISEARKHETLQEVMPPLRYGFRSFDRQWIIPDNRLINQPSPDLWRILGNDQVYLTACLEAARVADQR